MDRDRLSVSLGRRFARLATNAVVRRAGLWRLFRSPLRRQFDRLAPRWDEIRTPDHLAAFERALERVEPQPRRALDLGTGTGDGAFAVVNDRDALDKPAYDVRTLLDYYPIIDELVSAMNRLGWDVYSFDHEDAVGQFETDFAYADALVMADRFTFFRWMTVCLSRQTSLIC